MKKHFGSNSYPPDFNGGNSSPVHGSSVLHPAKCLVFPVTTVASMLRAEAPMSERHRELCSCLGCASRCFGGIGRFDDLEFDHSLVSARYRFAIISLIHWKDAFLLVPPLF